MIFQKYSKVVAFMIMCIVVQTAFGDKALSDFLFVILMSMILINADKFIEMLGGI